MCPIVPASTWWTPKHVAAVVENQNSFALSLQGLSLSTEVGFSTLREVKGCIALGLGFTALQLQESLIVHLPFGFHAPSFCLCINIVTEMAKYNLWHKVRVWYASCHWVFLEKWHNKNGHNGSALVYLATYKITCFSLILKIRLQFEFPPAYNSNI